MTTTQTVTIGRTTYTFTPEVDIEHREWDGQLIHVGAIHNTRGRLFADVYEIGNGTRFAATNSRGLVRITMPA